MCKGCKNIREENFPFSDKVDLVRRKFFIDQEHQGVNDEEYLRIYYCPVCGKRLGVNYKK